MNALSNNLNEFDDDSHISSVESVKNVKNTKLNYSGDPSQTSEHENSIKGSCDDSNVMSELVKLKNYKCSFFYCFSLFAFCDNTIKT